MASQGGEAGEAVAGVVVEEEDLEGREKGEEGRKNDESCHRDGGKMKGTREEGRTGDNRDEGDERR